MAFPKKVALVGVGALALLLLVGGSSSAAPLPPPPPNPQPPVKPKPNPAPIGPAPTTPIPADVGAPVTYTLVDVDPTDPGTFLLKTPKEGLGATNQIANLPSGTVVTTPNREDARGEGFIGVYVVGGPYAGRQGWVDYNALTDPRSGASGAAGVAGVPAQVGQYLKMHRVRTSSPAPATPLPKDVRPWLPADSYYNNPNNPASWAQGSIVQTKTDTQLLSMDTRNGQFTTIANVPRFTNLTIEEVGGPAGTRQAFRVLVRTPNGLVGFVDGSDVMLIAAHEPPRPQSTES